MSVKTTESLSAKEADQQKLWNKAFYGNGSTPISEKAANYSDGLQVIGAGLSRTGTSTMQTALEILYDAPGYHMRTIIGEDKVDFWRGMNKGTVSIPEIREHLKGFASIQDAPPIFNWEKLLEAFPNAKVVMTTREFEAWYRSIDETILVGQPRYPKMWWGIYFLQKISPFWRRWADMLWGCWGGNPKYLNGDYSKESFKRLHESWTKSVIATCPKDKLLIFDVKQGWEPLCKFLGKPVPNVPFPNVNDSKQCRQLHIGMNRLGYAFLGLLGLTVGVCAAGGYFAYTHIQN